MTIDDKSTGTLRYEEKPVYTTSNGCPVYDPESSQRVFVLLHHATEIEGLMIFLEARMDLCCCKTST